MRYEFIAKMYSAFANSLNRNRNLQLGNFLPSVVYPDLFACLISTFQWRWVGHAHIGQRYDDGKRGCSWTFMDVHDASKTGAGGHDQPLQSP